MALYIYLFLLSTLRYDSIHICTKYEDTGLKAKRVLLRQSSITKQINHLQEVTGS
jgi:hypothetical protein